MGTRHLICVFYNGRFVVAQYGQWDGDQQGARLVKFLRMPDNIQRLKDGLSHTYEASEEETVAAEKQLNELPVFESWDFADWTQDTTKKLPSNLCPSLCASTGAAILEVISRAEAERKVPISLELSFANDGLFCEFAFVVDLDKEVLEVFIGCEKKTPNHRFGDVGENDNTVPSFISSFTFSKLQSMRSEEEFVSQVNKDMVSVLAIAQSSTVLTS